MNESISPLSNSLDGRREAVRLASYILHKHYCENDVNALLGLLDDEDECFSWFGAAEHEYAIGSRTVAAIFEEFRGKVPLCNISDEHFDVIEPAPGVYLVSGTYWVATDPSVEACIRVHQRTTMGFRIRSGRLKCFHIHLSNPYTEMVSEDVGFPTLMSAQSYEYLQERLEEQVRILEEQSAELASIYATAPCAIMRLLRTEDGYEPVFINPATARIMGISEDELEGLDWSGGYCELLVEEDARMARSLMATLRKPGDRVEMVCKLVRPSGETVYISSNNEFVGRDERGDIIQKIVFDISDRIALEQTLEKQSFEDSLTGMFNRNKFNQQMRDGDHRPPRPSRHRVLRHQRAEEDERPVRAPRRRRPDPPRRRHHHVMLRRQGVPHRRGRIRRHRRRVGSRAVRGRRLARLPQHEGAPHQHRGRPVVPQRELRCRGAVRRGGQEHVRGEGPALPHAPK